MQGHFALGKDARFGNGSKDVGEPVSRSRTSPDCLAWASPARAVRHQYTLKSQRPDGETSQVEVLLEVGGDLSLMNEKEKRVQAPKMSVVGSMVYDERLLGTDDDASTVRGVRQYRRCDAVIKIDKRKHETPPARRAAADGDHSE